MPLRLLPILLGLILATGCVTPPGEPQNPGYLDTNLALGRRQLDRVAPGAEALGELDGLGLEGVILPRPRWPLGLELGLTHASRAVAPPALAPLGGEVELTTFEFAAGLRVWLHRSLPGGFPVEPYVGLGWLRAYGDLDLVLDGFELSFSDSGTATYLRLGVQVRLTPWLHLGLDQRFTDGAEAKLQVPQLGAATLDLDHSQFSVFLGLRL
jgi:hypothetical protein